MLVFFARYLEEVLNSTSQLGLDVDFRDGIVEWALSVVPQSTTNLNSQRESTHLPNFPSADDNPIRYDATNFSPNDSETFPEILDRNVYPLKGNKLDEDRQKGNIFHPDARAKFRCLFDTDKRNGGNSE
ncbi:hypothetical protein CDAR_82331 [Caerostris darwini]|uniref:Uncharacterized protein n=1 Tax=Caerostris darwini TaxID=1538125 RepID=A0AAV4QBK8_9ARAC|nr:hypothetical protein CDAR_82331 [Caerostris darwini]